MVRDLAKSLALKCVESLSCLNQLLPVLKDRCDYDEYEMIFRVVSEINYDVSTKILSYVFDKHPGLEDEVEDEINNSGNIHM